MYRGSLFLCFCILVQLLLKGQTSPPPADSDALARMEDKALSSVSLKFLEELVEKDDKVRDVEKKFTLSNSEVLARAGIVINESDKTSGASTEHAPTYQNYPEPVKKSKAKKKAAEPVKRVSGREGSADSDELLVWLPATGLLTEESRIVEQFMESLAERLTTKKPKEEIDTSEFAETSDIPAYRPRFDYDSYSKDPLSVKLNGKNYWRDSDHASQPNARSDEEGCTMVVKKIRDPEDAKKSSDGSRVQSVILTKECVHPDGSGSDAKLPVVQQVFRPTQQQHRNAAFDADKSAKIPILQYESRDVPAYRETVQEQRATPLKSDDSRQYSRDSLNSDYIDRMLDAHFKNFPDYRSSSSSLKDLERGLNAKPKNFDVTEESDGYKIRSYQHEEPSYTPTHRNEPSSPRVYTSTPKVRIEGNKKIYDHHHHYYHYPENKGYSISSDVPDQGRQTYQPDHSEEVVRPYHEEPSNTGAEPKSLGGEEESPKMFKKSFAYYRKDNPKDDPNNQEYAEEYAQGNYRSISSSYDSEKDDPNKKKAE